MKKSFVLACGVIAAGMGLAAERDVLLAGEGWKFVKDATTNHALRAEAPGFDDSAWESVRVPHDWAISGPFDESQGGGTGKLPWKGVGWYRRSFDLAAADAGCSVFLDFDGVMASPEVYVNGRKAGAWGYGYESVRVDVTPFVKFGGRNVLAVRVDTTRMWSRWYPGAGIYRKVTMKVRSAAHFAHDGIFVTTPAVDRRAATVRVAWELEGPVPADAQVKVAVSAADGAAVAAVACEAVQGAALVKVAEPKLWDVESPNLYFADVTLADAAGAPLSRERIRFGIRTIAFPTPTEEPAKSDRAANGFHLNGRRVQLKGVDLHSDLGPLGMAFDKSAMRRQLQLMKDMGANALRTSHNCPAPEVLELCDEMGILVWDEAFDKWDGTAGRGAEDLEVYVARILRGFVRRDRNHPSVIIWSMSNEICEQGHEWSRTTGLTKERCSYFREVMRREDATRPVGNGNISFMCQDRILDQGMFDDLDVTGWNYGASYRNVKKRYPKMAFVYSESASAFSSYGFYEDRLPKSKNDYASDVFQTSGYDFTAGPDIADVEFDRMEKDAYCCGEFVWTGIDYLGEPTPFGKESRSSYFGIADLMGIPKDRYWLYRSHWNDRAETLHVVPHWTWPGREGKNVPVFVYTSGDSAELFVNGKSQGMRRKGKPEKPVNLFAGAKATASSEESHLGNVAAKVVDGDSLSRWCANGPKTPAWILLEAPKAVEFSSVRVDFESEVGNYAYRLEASLDGREWKTIHEKKTGDGGHPTFDRPQTAKFLRLTVTNTRSDKRWPSVREITVGDRLSLRPDAYYDICSKYRLMWFEVPYEPGELKAVFYRNGKRLGETSVRTAGAPAALAAKVEPKLTADADELAWVQVDALDAKGVRNPSAMNRVRFRLDGPGKILGVGNGNAHAFEAFTKTESHPMFYGKVVAVVRRDGPGALKLTVESDGLKSAAVDIP